jgi:DNA polymerase III subunit epsilon
MRTSGGLAAFPVAAIVTQFAAADVETTGVFPARARVVEVAVMRLDPDTKVTGEFGSLIDPRRDTRPTRITPGQAQSR